MARLVTLNGVSYSIPTTGETGWGDETTNYLVAIGTGGLLSLDNPTFTLLQDVNVGPNYSFVGPYFKSDKANISTTGFIRMENTGLVSWRNFANSANVSLGVDSSNRLVFNGSLVTPPVVWGQITGTLSNQTDLQNALNTSATKAVWGSITGTLSNQTDLNTAINTASTKASWGSITGALTSQTDLNNSLNAKLNLTGGTLTGALILNANPTNNLGAATKQYVDSAVSGIGGSPAWGSITGTLSNQTDLQNALNAKLNLSGGTMTGLLTLSGNPVANLGAATKQYVDNSPSPSLTTARSIAASGDITWSVNFDGSTNVSSPATIPASVVIGKTLVGYGVGSNSAITAGDTIVGAFGKVQAQLNASAPSQFVLKTGDTMSGSLTVSGSIYTNTVTSQSGGIIAIRDGMGNVNSGGSIAQIETRAATAGAALITFHRAGAYAMQIGLDNDNVFRIGGWSDGASYRWQADTTGNFTARGNVTAYSDERLKKNWRPVTDDFLNKLSKIRYGIYQRKDTNEWQCGVSAQDLREVLPEAIMEDNNGILSVNYGAAAMVAIIHIARILNDLTSRT